MSTLWANRAEHMWVSNAAKLTVHFAEALPLVGMGIDYGIETSLGTPGDKAIWKSGWGALASIGAVAITGATGGGALVLGGVVCAGVAWVAGWQWEKSGW